MKRTPKKRRYTEEAIEELREALDKWAERKGKHITFWLGDFAFEHHMDRARLSEIAKRDESFARSLISAKQRQESWLFHDGRLSTHPTMQIFALKNVAGWRDKTEIEHSGTLKLTSEEISKLPFSKLIELREGRFTTTEKN